MCPKCVYEIRLILKRTAAYYSSNVCKLLENDVFFDISILSIATHLYFLEIQHNSQETSCMYDIRIHIYICIVCMFPSRDVVVSKCC